MKIYLVREAGTTKIHGVFWANCIDRLWDAVEEMGDPSLFEYSRVKGGGGVWTSLNLSSTPEIPQFWGNDDFRGDEDFEPCFNMHGDALFLAMHNQILMEWKRFGGAS
jgi:hypothetical protein